MPYEIKYIVNLLGITCKPLSIFLYITSLKFLAHEFYVFLRYTNCPNFFLKVDRGLKDVIFGLQLGYG